MQRRRLCISHIPRVPQQQPLLTTTKKEFWKSTDAVMMAPNKFDILQTAADKLAKNVRVGGIKSAVTMQAAKMARVNGVIIDCWAAGARFWPYETKKSVMCRKSVMSRSLQAGL